MENRGCFIKMNIKKILFVICCTIASSFSIYYIGGFSGFIPLIIFPLLSTSGFSKQYDDLYVKNKRNIFVNSLITLGSILGIGVVFSGIRLFFTTFNIFNYI